MGFDPNAIDDDRTGEGHLDQVPLYDVLLALRATTATGRLTIAGSSGDNHMFFMRGQPVGVTLAEYFHPLGQLLLELGRVDARTFIRAQRLIAEGARLPGQVFKELGVLDDGGLKDVLSIQSRKKAEEFCRIGSRPFLFGKGLTFLTGFTSTPLDIHVVVFIAVRQQMGPASRQAFLDGLAGREVRVPAGTTALPGPAEAYGFGPAEGRFLTRLESGFIPVPELLETGALPADDVAVLLRFLDLVGRLTAQPITPRRPAPDPISAPNPVARATPAGLDDVFSSAPEAALPTRSPVRASAEATDPRLRAPSGDIHNVPTQLPEPSPAPPPRSSSVIIAPELLGEEPPKPKKKKKRTEPLPSTGTTAVSMTRREKTTIQPLPSIVIEEGE